MTTLFQHTDFPIARDYFDILLMTMTAPRFIQNSTALVFVKDNVLSGLINILPLVFKNNELQQLISYHIETSSDLCFDLVVAYLHACILIDDEDYFGSNAEFFSNTFKVIFQGGNIFVDTNDFDEVINIYATLTLLDSTQALLLKMQYFVIKGNLALSFACTEVLISASSCVDICSDELVTRLEFWFQTRNRYAKFSSNFRRLNIDHLIGHYFKLCLCKISIIEIQAQLPLCFTSFNNCNIFCYATDYIDKAELESSRSAVTKKLCKLMDGRNGLHIENYYETVAYMYEVMRYKTDISRDVQKQLSDLLDKVCKIWTKHNFSFERLVNSGLSLMREIHVTDASLIQILELLKYVVDSGKNFHVLSFWLFLEACSNQPKDSKVCISAQAILNCIKVPDIIQVSIFRRTALDPCAPTVVSKYYAQIEYYSECTICINPYFVQRKRSRSEVGYEDTEEIIQNIGHLVSKLKHSSKPIKKSHVGKLNNVVLDIKKITANLYNEE
ncbi:uncharacterized protein LOC118744132 isoform X1 [Rhagoletis pomonella]|uniref:uncharacterized protein LOC118744132 isoform X1 n=1 Tax=Rhagoletis pomonella TaxID=28610 RepID=UPI00177FA7B3|nr:uncharacterized protein LOC118744132 isoform X1 [Rhagoletis pomonella]